MIHCRGCGREIHESAISCPGCGAQQMAQANYKIVSGVDANIFTSYMYAWKTAFQFGGRIRRKTYWYFILTHVIVSIVCAFVDQALRTEIVSALYSIAVLVPNISMGIRRMHDVNRSGWWFIVPFVNLYFAIKDSDPGMNDYGASPKYAMA